MKDLRTAFFIARKSIVKGSKSTLLLMVFILSLTFLNMMFITGVLTGLTESEVNALIGYLSSHISVSPQELPQPKQFIFNQGELRSQIESVPGVVATARHYLMAGSLAFDKTKNGVLKSVSGTIIGIDPSDEKKVLTFSNLIIYGSYLDDGDTDSIVMSSALAGGYNAPAPSDLGGVKVGDRVRVTYSNGIMRTYKVKGIYNDLMGLYESFITAREAQTVLGTYDTATQILVKADLTKDTLKDYQTKVKALAPNLKVQTYDDLLASFASFLKALDLITLVVAVISIAVAAFTIFVLIYINAITKRRQIGILKAIGINQGIIVNAYIMQSIFYTFCAVAFGLFMTFGVFKPLLEVHPIPIIEGLMNLSLVYSAMKVVLAVVAFVVAGFLAGYVPSKIVARQNILEAIWG